MASIVRIIRKFSFILSGRQKLRIFQLIILMIIGGVLETCSVSLILPFMDMIMNPETAMEKRYVKAVCIALRIESSSTFLVITAILLATLYILKNAYLMFEYNVQYRFVYGNMFAFQERLLSTFIHRPYEYFLYINSADVIRIVGPDTANAFGLLVTMLSLFTEVVVSGMLLAAIFIIYLNTGYIFIY